MSINRESVEYYLSPQAIRDGALAIYAQAQLGLTHFKIHPSKFDEVSDFVLKVIQSNYPDLKIPYHSRLGHFQTGGRDRLQKVRDLLIKNGSSSDEVAMTMFDLVIPSVLLDAGSGAKWKFVEKETGETVARSEGLAVASLYMFLQGAFSSSEKNLLQADSKGLSQVTAEKVGQAFQVTDSNPLLGLEGRASLLRSLGMAVEKNKQYFLKPESVSTPRVGHLYLYLKQKSLFKNGKYVLPAKEVLHAILYGLGNIWPGRIEKEGKNLGDAWFYPPLEKIIVFHKLSQWLTYSLFEILETAGFEITNIGELTGLAEYRNGGLLLDTGLIELRNPVDYEKIHAPDSELIVEWRALTIVFLDLLAEKIREKLKMNEVEFPLAKVLEGGTWWAGRKIAALKRPQGVPPLMIQSDGTVF